MAIGCFEMESMSEKVSLRWNDFQTNLSYSFQTQLNSSNFTDVTLVSADGQQSVHRLVLSAGSPLLANLLTSLPPNPVLYFWDVQASLLSTLVEFLYKGKVEVTTSDLAAFLALADKLKVRGLAGSVLKEEQQEPVLITAGLNEENQVVEEMKESEDTPRKEKPCMARDSGEKMSKMHDKLKSSPLWQYFQNDCIKESEVICKLCNVKVKLGKKGSLRLSDHMEKRHTEEWASAFAEKVEKESLENAIAGEIETEGTFSAAEEAQISKTVPLPIWITGATGGKKRGRQPDSKLWNFFQRSSKDMLVAFCNRCQKKVRRGKEGTDLRRLGNTGMVSHLKSSHPEDLILLQKLRAGVKFAPVEAAGNETKKKDSAKSTEVWFYFDRLENGGAACQVGECPVELDGEDSLLKEHLATHLLAF